eukprot:m.88631 g.88631  ORF g.88631 m.88631 type:complete len:490 (-) comp8813_c1_seq1:102-1571(-)
MSGTDGVIYVAVTVALVCCNLHSLNVCASSVRKYFMSGEEVLWDYAPSGRDLFMGQSFTEMNANVGDNSNTGKEMLHQIGHHHSAAMWMERTESRIGRQYYKARYIEYTDASFSARKPIEQKWKHLGLLGPVIRAEVGDTIKVVYRNTLPFPTSIHPHGLHYTKHNEGAPYNDSTTSPGNALRTGETFTYTWEVPERSGPAEGDGSSVAFIYHSHADEPKDVSAGLFGLIVITAKGMAKRDGSPNDVDRELVGGMFILDESLSWFFGKNVETFLNSSLVNIDELVEEEHFQMSNMMHSINGLAYGNALGFDVKQWERVRWYILVVGNEKDIHTPHWHGNTLVFQGHRVDVLQALPAVTEVADMKPDNAGKWMFQCHVHHHVHGGMYTSYTVHPAPKPTTTTSTTPPSSTPSSKHPPTVHQQHGGIPKKKSSTLNNAVAVVICVGIIVLTLLAALCRSRVGKGLVSAKSPTSSSSSSLPYTKVRRPESIV